MNDVTRFSLAADIAAPPDRVWRALCDPTEVVRWDGNVVEALDAPIDYPRPGQHVRWRCRSGAFRLLHDRPLEVVPERMLRSRLALGPFRYDETYVLDPLPFGCRLTATLAVRAALPLIGPAIERLYLLPATRAALAGALDRLRSTCEQGP